MKEPPTAAAFFGEILASALAVEFLFHALD
jgi:hypothetical protein